MRLFWILAGGDFIIPPCPFVDPLYIPWCFRSTAPIKMGKPTWIGYGRREEVNEKGKPTLDGHAKEKEIDAAEIVATKASGSVEKIENVESIRSSQDDVKLSKRRRTARHLRRFWCCYGILGIVVLAILLPIAYESTPLSSHVLTSFRFLVVIPAIAQRMVESTSLPIHFVSIMNPTFNSTVLSLNASLKIPPPFKVRLEPLTLQLYRPETKPNIVPYVNFPLGEQWVKGNTTISVVNQTVEIADKKEFIAFLRDAVVNEKFVLAARGETTAHLGALKAKIKLDKQIELYGEANCIPMHRKGPNIIKASTSSQAST